MDFSDLSLEAMLRVQTLTLERAIAAEADLPIRDTGRGRQRERRENGPLLADVLNGLATDDAHRQRLGREIHAMVSAGKLIAHRPNNTNIRRVKLSPDARAATETLAVKLFQT